LALIGGPRNTPDRRPLGQTGGVTGGLGHFVGRGHELALLRTALPPAGAGAVVLVAGDAGIGKTSLISETLRDTSVTTVWGSCWDGTGAPALWPWIEVIRGCLATPGGETWQRSDDVAVPEVLGLLPEHGSSTPATSRFMLLDGIARLLDAAASPTGLAVVLDDLHWADAGTLSLLAFLVRRLRAAPVSVLGTFRDVEVGADHPLTMLLAELGGRVQVLPLDGLPVDDLQRLSGNDPGAVLSGDDATALHRLTGGNPFFARELLALRRADATGRPIDAGRLPPGVQAVVERRLTHLSHGCADVLRGAAVLGPVIVPEDLAAVTGLEPVDVVERLAEAEAARVVVGGASAGTGTGWRFAHDLLRQTIYTATSPTVRAELHARAGDVLAARPGAQTTLAPAIAHHLLAAVGAGDPLAAVEAALRAGEQAQAVMADAEAAAWFERAAALARARSLDATTVLAALLSLGEARLRHGDLPRARAAYLEAAAIARETDRPDDLARAALGLGAGLGGFEVRMFDETQITLLEEALTAIGPAATTRRAQLLARLSIALSFVAEHDRRRSLADEAVAVARRLGDQATLGYCLAAWCDAVAGPTHSEARAAAAREVVDLATAAGDPRLELLGRRLLLVALLELGDVAGADEQIAAYERTPLAGREPLYRWYLPLWRGMRALMAGQTDECERWTAEADVIGTAAHSDNAAMLVLTQRWVRHRVEGDLMGAGGLLEGEGTAIFGPLPSVLPFTVLRDLLLRRTDVAAASYRSMLDALLRAPEEDAERLPALAQAVEAVLAFGDRDGAARLEPVLAPFDDRVVIEGIGAAVYGPLGHYRALLLDLLGRSDEARELRVRVAELDSALGLQARPEMLRPAAEDRPERAAELSAATLERDGEVWALTFAGRTVRVRDTKGLRDLAVLLARPGEEVHVRDLATTDAAGQAAMFLAGTEVLDRQAIAAYRRRLADLDEDLDEAEAHHDEGRIARVATERDFLLAELAGGLGLGGRPRRVADDVDRARKAVRARLRDAIGRVGALHPDLGAHLTESVRTGTRCAYSPAAPVTWTVRA
jgi:tetratricopeptide (TPR) repeat protein